MFELKDSTLKSYRFAACAAALLTAGLCTSVQADAMMVHRGTQLYAVVDQRISSKTNHDGDQVRLLLKDGFFHKNPPELSGAVIDAHIENDTPASPTHKATMNIVFDDVKLPNGTSMPLAAQLRSVKELEPHTHHIRDAGLIIGGFTVGHMMAGSHHGGMAGAAAGFALASSLKSDIVLNRNSQMTLRLTQDLTQ